MSSLFLGGLLGLLLGLAWCYWKQIMLVYNNQGLISSGSSLVGDAQNFYANLQKL